MYFSNNEPELFGMLTKLFLAYLELPLNLFSGVPIVLRCLNVTVWGYKYRHKQGGGLHTDPPPPPLPLWGWAGGMGRHILRSPQGELSVGKGQMKIVMCPCQGSDPASGHPRLLLGHLVVRGQWESLPTKGEGSRKGQG